MKTLTIHFSRNKDGAIFSKLLQWYEGIPISHVLIEFETPKLGQNFVYHSVIGTGVSLLSRKRFDSKNEIMETYKITITEEMYQKMRNGLLDNCGEHYAMWQNVGILIVDKCRKLLGIRVKNPWKDGQNCSELVYRYVIPYVCNKVDYNIQPDLVKPSDIRNMLKVNNINAVYSAVI